MKRKINIKEAWNKISEDYQKQEKIPTINAHYGPGVPDENKLNLLGNIKSKKILEIGCGGGQCSIAFAKQGAIATGIDISDEQIKFAKQKAKKEKVKVNFLIGNIENLERKLFKLYYTKSFYERKRFYRIC